MQKSEQLSPVGVIKANAFYDYKPAELKMNQRWFVIFYAKNPLTEKLERFRVSVPVIKQKTERIKHGKKMVLEINRKLESGWLPFYASDGTQEFKSWEFCTNKLIEFVEADIKKGLRRPDTLRAYNSYINMINKFCAEKNIKLNLVLELNKTFVVRYLDWILYERNNSEVTYNNHLTFITNFVNFCISRGWLKENFCSQIKRKKEQEKTRQIFTPEVKEKVRSLEKINKQYYTLCMMTYFCFIRRTELTKIKVCDISLINQTITIENTNSKNKKTEIVTIPNAYINLLADHIKKANNDDYVFSGNNFATGKTKMNPKKISDTWEKYRKQLNIKSEFQFYSLKDTGITDLLNAGVPALKVRNQARHSDIKITEKYTSRNKQSDEVVQNSNFFF